MGLVGKVMFLFLNMLSRLVITFLPRSKHLLISWLQSPSEVILEPPKIKSDTVSPSISHEVITLCKTDSQQEFAVWLRKLKQELYINLEDGEGDGRKVQKGGDISIPMADSC